MYKLTIQNSDLLELNFNELSGGAYNITNIQGLSPAEATINTSQAALLDGAFFNSSKVNMRTINLAFTIEEPVEYNRLFAYQVLKPKEPVTLYYKSNALDVFIEGYVKSVSIGHFDAKQKATVQIICPSPYWKAAQEVIDELSIITNMFYFPFGSEGGKNLLPYPYDYSTRTKNGVTFTDNGDGTITVIGTATAYTDFAMQSRTDTATPYTLDAGTYTVSGCPEGGSSTTYRILVGITVNGAWQTIAADSGNGATFSYDPSMGNLGVVIAVYNGTTLDDVTFAPMIRYANVSDDTWQPYDYGEIIFGEIDTQAEAIVLNASGIETGLKFQLYASSQIVNPKIFNYLTGEFIGLNFTMQAGDLITITTGRGEKSIILFRNGVLTNIFNSIMQGSTWLMLPSGGAVYVYTVESGTQGNLEITISHNDLYEGV